MLQVRKLVLAVAAATAFSSSLTHALGLGDLAVKSSLNQPLNAEISLLQVRDLTSIEIKSQLASPEDFSKAGIDRQFFLTGLKFTPMIDAKGKSVIRVTSSKPVKEPYLNFLVEILWPNGRLLREYTVLLDPPLYTPQKIVYAPQPATIASSGRSSGSVQQSASSQSGAPVASGQPVARPTSALQGSEYRVQKNDTLWEIAERVGGNSAVHQTMVAIQDLNPNAFLDGNINRIKNAQVLRLPTEQDINRRTRAQAIAHVAQQNNSWKNQASAERQLDATYRSEAGATPATVEKTDNLRLVAGASGQAQKAADQGNTVAGAGVIQDQLSVAQERLDSTSMENQDLKVRVDDLNGQLEKLQRLIELKDNQLAQMQNAVDAPASVAMLDLVEESDLKTDTSTFELDTGLVPEYTESVDGLEGLEGDFETTEESVIEPQYIVEPEPVIEPESVVPPQTEVSVPAAEQVQEEQKLLDQLMENPMLLAAIGGGTLLAILLLLMAMSRRNARKESEETETHEDNQHDVAEKSVDTYPLTKGAAQEQHETPLTPEFEKINQFDFDSVAAENPFKEQPIDAIAEADKYISYGRFNQAADVLNTAVDQEPQRIDLRLKLVEVLADLDDREGLSRQVQEITEIGGAGAELLNIKARYPHMFDAAPVDNVADKPDFGEFDLDSFTLDTQAETVQREKNIEAELDDLSALLAETESDIKAADTDFGDFNLDIDSPTASSSVVTEEIDTGASLDDFSLNLDTELEATAVAEVPTLSKEDDFADLPLSDFDLELPATSSLETADLETTEFDLDTDFNFAATDVENQFDSEFGAQFDEVNAELDNLTAALSDEVLELNVPVEPVLAEVVPEIVEPVAEPVAEFVVEAVEAVEPIEEIEPVAVVEMVELAEPVELVETTVEAVETFDLAEPTHVEAPAAATLMSDFDDLHDLHDLDGLNDDFDILAGTDETGTKLDLARAYVDMGDAEGARDILEEVIVEGNPFQQEQARALIAELG